MRRPLRPYIAPRAIGELERPRTRPAAPVPPARVEGRARLTFALIWGVFIRFLLIAALVYLAYRARFVLVTIFIAALLALTLSPMVDALARLPLPGRDRRARRSVAALLVFVLLGVALFFSYELLVHPVLSEAGRLMRTLQQEAGHWQEYMASAQEVFQQLPPGLQKALQEYRLENIAARIPQYLTGFLHTSAEWITFVVELVLIPILAFYLIVEWRGLKREYIALVPARWRRDAIAITRSAGRILRDYTLANLVLCLIAGAVVYVGLSILHVPYALSLSVLAGITRFVPVIGPIIGAIPILLIALGQGTSVAAGVLVFFILLHLVESKLLLPKLIGDRLNIHGALVLIALLLGGEFAGIIGMFLAAPVAALVRVLLRTYLLRTRRRLPVNPPKPPRPSRPPSPSPTRPAARLTTPSADVSSSAAASAMESAPRPVELS